MRECTRILCGQSVGVCPAIHSNEWTRSAGHTPFPIFYLFIYWPG